MTTLVNPAMSSHIRSGRFVQHERPAANIPARMRSRRLAGGSQFFGTRARTAVLLPVSPDQESTKEKLCGWILGRLATPRD